MTHDEEKDLDDWLNVLAGKPPADDAKPETVAEARALRQGLRYLREAAENEPPPQILDNILTKTRTRPARLPAQWRWGMVLAASVLVAVVALPWYLMPEQADMTPKSLPVPSVFAVVVEDPDLSAKTVQQALRDAGVAAEREAWQLRVDFSAPAQVAEVLETQGIYLPPALSATEVLRLEFTIEE